MYDRKQRAGRYAQSDHWRDIVPVRGHQVGSEHERVGWQWNAVYLYILMGIAYVALCIGTINLQVVRGKENSLVSKQNRLEEQVVQPDRGVIYDRHGEKLAINVPSFNIVLDPRDIAEEELPELWAILASLMGTTSTVYEETYQTAIGKDNLTRRVLLAQDVTRDQVLQVRSREDDLPGIHVESTSKRQYIGGAAFAHILGYTGVAYRDEELSANVELGDVVGKEGIEYQYDDRLRGITGTKIIEIDAFLDVVNEYTNDGTAPIPGDSVYLSIDAGAQRKLYAILTKGVEKYGATGGAGIVEDVRTGEIIAMVNVPSYDNNLFIGGISEKDFSALMSSSGVPLLNRAIGAQVPPGSMFKTIVASAALQETAITRDTVFVSPGIIYLGDGSYPFQEYHQHVYGALNLIGGIAKSSNIYFCKTMLALGIDKFVPYAEFFGIGSVSGIDLPGEATGRVPSPENKLELSETSPWLDPIWYPEGDACNSAIGQGITSVTPLQVANWAAAIANGGKIMQPHLAYRWASADGSEETITPDIVREGMVSDANLSIVREGMRNSASGPLSVIVPLRSTKIPVAGKTGTAEYGIKDARGYYTKTHAWVMGFFPYASPKYSFTVFLEGGGESNNSAQLAADFINWWAANRQ